MAGPGLTERIHDLTDLELATLLCLIAKEHCIIETEPEALDDLEHELRLVDNSSTTIARPF